jgi:hypothetical protein
MEPILPKKRSWAWLLSRRSTALTDDNAMSMRFFGKYAASAAGKPTHDDQRGYGWL